MQYTAKKPLDSVVIVHPNGIRFRFRLPHDFTELRYNQITKVDLKSSWVDIYFVVGMLVIEFFRFISSTFSWLDILFLSAWIILLGYLIYIPKIYQVRAHKGPLVVELFATHDKKTAKQLKNEIESHLPSLSLPKK